MGELSWKGIVVNLFFFPYHVQGLIMRSASFSMGNETNLRGPIIPYRHNGACLQADGMTGGKCSLWKEAHFRRWEGLGRGRL